jgi:hypothetical protein
MTIDIWCSSYIGHIAMTTPNTTDRPSRRVVVYIYVHVVGKESVESQLRYVYQVPSFPLHYKAHLCLSSSTQRT